MDGIDQTTPASPSADYYNPYPSSTGTGTYSDIANTALDVAGDIAGVSLDYAGLGGGLGDLLQTQFQLQMEMATLNLVSNIERTKHESKMSVIRNIRVS